MNKKGGCLKVIGGIVVLFIAVAVIIAITSPDKPGSTMGGIAETTKAAADTATTAVTTQQETKAAKQWIEVIAFEGKSIKDTKTFHITSKEWVIAWSTTPGEYGDMNFQIYVYSSDGNLEGVAANVIGKASDESYMRGAGDYYLSINTAQDYKIKISEHK